MQDTTGHDTLQPGDEIMVAREGITIRWRIELREAQLCAKLAFHSANFHAQGKRCLSAFVRSSYLSPQRALQVCNMIDEAVSPGQIVLAADEIPMIFPMGQLTERSYLKGNSDAVNDIKGVIYGQIDRLALSDEQQISLIEHLLVSTCSTFDLIDEWASAGLLSKAQYPVYCEAFEILQNFTTGGLFRFSQNKLANTNFGPYHNQIRHQVKAMLLDRYKLLSASLAQDVDVSGDDSEIKLSAGFMFALPSPREVMSKSGIALEALFLPEEDSVMGIRPAVTPDVFTPMDMNSPKVTQKTLPEMTCADDIASRRFLRAPRRNRRQPLSKNHVQQDDVWSQKSSF